MRGHNLQQPRAAAGAAVAVGTGGAVARAAFALAAFALAAVAVAAVAPPPPAHAASAVNPYVHVKLRPTAGSGVSGSALVAAKSDGTRVTVTLYGLAPKAAVRAFLHAGTCARPSASFAAIVSARATATGSASATGAILFHGAPVSFIGVADGEHIVTVVAGSRVAACGAIPVMH